MMKLPLIIDVRRGAHAKYPDAHLVIDADDKEVMLVFPNEQTGNYDNTQPIVDAVNGAGWRIDIDNAPKYVEGEASVSFLLSVEQEGGAVQHVAEAYRDDNGSFWWTEDKDAEHGNIVRQGWAIVAWRPMPLPAPRTAAVVPSNGTKP